jgi:hypothetical protein
LIDACRLSGIDYSIYADDIKLSVGGPDRIWRMQVALDAVDEWLVAKNMKVSPAKSKYLGLGNKSRDPDPRYHIGGGEIGPVVEMRDLGVSVDRGLRYRGHHLETAR